MKNLLDLLFRYYGFMLFVLLQTIAFALLVTYNKYHQSKIVTSSSVSTGGLFDFKTDATKYLNLDFVNEQLAGENARLREQNREYQHLITSLSVDSSFAELNNLPTQYLYIQAKVINSSINKPTNTLTLNKGTVHGIEKDMAVIGPEGLIGIVTNTSSHFASVLPSINMLFTASIKIASTQHFGLLKWNSKDWRISQINDIAKHAKVEKGDSIVTRGGSSVFPENILVGLVDTSYVQPGSNYHHIDVKLTTDFSNISYVYVVKNQFKLEQLTLEQKTTFEQ
jgi:rod shape-determining protein MreC